MDDDADPRTCSIADLKAASVHLEDLEIFVGQRSRMHPGPGWAVTLAIVRENLASVRRQLAARGAGAGRPD